jgi:DNA uptake protein ComE-like DNA-binding protein
MRIANTNAFAILFSNFLVKTMSILYSIDGQSVQAFGSYIADYLRQGYSTAPPNQPESAIASPLAALTELTGSTDINTASIKELQALPLIGVAIAKKIIAARPYKDLPDLINKIPDINCLDLRGQITISSDSASMEG